MSKEKRMEKYAVIQKELYQLLGYFNQIDSKPEKEDYISIDIIRHNIECLEKLIR